MINVKSEIKELKKVLLHRPKRELLLNKEELTGFLFDELPQLDKAMKEHEEFVNILIKEGVEVVFVEDLMTEVLNRNPLVKEEFLKQFLKEANLSRKDRELAHKIFSQIEDNAEFVLKTMEGIVEDGRQIVDPLPNLYFTRDHFASIGNSISLNHMYSETRRRETIYAEYIFKYHKDFKNTEKYYDRYNEFNIEGGDIFNLNEETLLVGTSQRTQTHAVSELASNIFSTNSKIKTIYAIDIPHARAYMHLDTVFTQLDEDKFVIYPKIMNELDVYRFTRNSSVRIDISIEELLEKELGRKVTLIKCGGDNEKDQNAEQWNDGANTLCIRPGVVVAYAFNTITNKLLRENGIKVIELNALELSKGRGGPRCMSMPLVRED